MKLSGLSTALIILLVLLVLQSIGGYMQIQDYRKAVRRMHHRISGSMSVWKLP